MPGVGPAATARASQERRDAPLQQAAERSGLVFNLGASGLILLLNIATGVLLARAFDPSARGGLAAAILWPSIIAIVGQLGLSDAVTFHVARRSAPTGVLIGSGLVIAVVRSVLLVAVAAALLPLVLGHYGNVVLNAGFLYLVFIPTQACSSVLLGTINGEKRYRLVALIRVLVNALSTLPLLFLFLANELTIERAIVAYLFAQAVNLATLVGATPIRVPQLRVRRSVVKQLLIYGVKAHVGTVSTQFNLRADQLVISIVLPARELGLYVVAVTITSLTALIGSTVGYVAIPSIAGETDATATRIAARRFISLTVILSLATAVPLILLAPVVVEFFFGSKYAAVAAVVRVLLVAAVAYSTARALEGVLRAVNRPWDASLGEIVALTATVAGLAALLPLFGLMGAAVASLAAYATSTAWMTWRLAPALDVSPGWLLLDGPRDALHVLDGVRRRLARASGRPPVPRP
jgi:O-antigen/teichoic acid export membrane protein